MKNNNSILITIVLGICILIGAWYFQVFTDYEVPSRILAAILGVVITAIITQLLLSSQTNKEVTLRQEQQKWQAEQDKLKQDRQKELAKETREWQEQQALKTQRSGKKSKIRKLSNGVLIMIEAILFSVRN